MKRFMADFIGTDAGKPERQQQQQQQPKADPVGAGVAFVSPVKKTPTVCHVYGKQHEGGHLKCRNIINEYCEGIDKLIKARAFDNKSGSGGNKPTVARSTSARNPTYCLCGVN